MIDAVDDGFTFSHQGGDDQRGRCTQVGRHHGSTFQAVDAADDGVVAFDLDVGPETHQLVDVHEAVFEDGFANGRDAIGDTVDGHELRLHVGRKGRIGCSTQTHRVEP